MRILHIGCGTRPLPEWIEGTEVRLDIDASVQPDLIAPMTALGDIGLFDIVYCSHALEHLFPHEVVIALSEFRRVLVPMGYALIIVPDLEGVTATPDVLYTSDSGLPISGFDMIYGHHRDTPGNPYMLHKTGFTAETMETALRSAGFNLTNIKRAADYNLVSIGVNS